MSRRNLLLGGSIVFFVVMLALPALLSLDPNRIDLDAVLVAPSRAHPLGTDENGRDELTRLLVGARETLGIGFGGAAIAVALGAGLGVLAGFRGRATDTLLMRAVDFMMAIPTLFVILLFTSIVRAGPVQLILLIGLTGWMPVARLVRGNVRGLVQAPYIEAARTCGASDWRLMARHLLPNTTNVIFVSALIQLSRAILTEATVSFLGLGIQPPAPTWGNMLIGAQDYLFASPWLAIAPGLAITGTLLVIASLQELPPRARSARHPRGAAVLTTGGSALQVPPARKDRTAVVRSH
ncbi:MAG: ABC transporter permease [Thermomicrobiales bacterium]